MKNNVLTFGLILLLVVSTISIQIPKAGSISNIEWDVTLDFRETSGKIDYVVFGEATDANDGPPPDDHDMIKPPPPMQPYLRAWFEDGLDIPYDKLGEDYRRFPDTEKTWDLYVRWRSTNLSITFIAISWDLDEFEGHEYDSIILNRYNSTNDEWDFATNMLTEDEYEYTPQLFNEMWLIDHFQIIAVTDVMPPETTCELEGELEEDIYVSNVTVTLEAIDDISGVAETYYKINDGAWEEYMGTPFVVSENGEHIVRFYSVDYAENTEDEKECTFIIEHPCYINLEIRGDFGVSAVIKNTGEEDLSDIEWSIVLKKGLVLIGREKTGVIENLPAGEEVQIFSFVFGIGFIDITITAGCAEKTARGLLFLIFVMEL